MKARFVEDVTINVMMQVTDLREIIKLLDAIDDTHPRYYTLKRIRKEARQVMRDSATNMKYESQSYINEYKEDEDA